MIIQINSLWHILIIMIWLNFSKCALAWKCHPPLPYTMQFPQNTLTHRIILKHRYNLLSVWNTKGLTLRLLNLKNTIIPLTFAVILRMFNCCIRDCLKEPILWAPFFTTKKASSKKKKLCMCWQETARMTWGIDLWVKKRRIFSVLVGLWRTVDFEFKINLFLTVFMGYS